MFDPKKPNNALPLLPGVFDYHDTKLYQKALQAQTALAKLNGLLHLLPNADVLISPLVTAESVSSSAIENINTTTVEVLKAQALPEDFRVGAEKEVLHYREAIMHGHQLVKQQGYLMINNIIDIQKIIEPHKIGIRALPGTVIANGAGEVLYTPPEGKDIILALLSNLETFMHTKDDIYPLIKTGLIHYQFEAIHPFYDGNGRTGRILMILYLSMVGLLDYPVLFISGYIHTHRDEYYATLAYTHKTDDYTKIIMYMLDAIHHQSDKTSDKIIRIGALIKKLEEGISQHIKKRPHALAWTLLSHPFITIQNIADNLGITRQTAAVYCKKLAAAGIVQMSEVGKYTLVSVPGFITLLGE